jgi:hypothetical protein
MKKNNTHGGKRPNAGRKPKYNEATTTVAFRVPVSKVEQVKELVRKLLKTN